ncbi:Pseudaminic acid synthase [termite gut metagenome]|uniref:Pseudaminic acid synthase n=1 Tax=termite gut metagenome TaxID=433724 RepID=A0A5J4R3L8_9ZZZZ
MINKVFIVAEFSANHNGCKELALKAIKAAKYAGADAIKLQTYTADTITINCHADAFKIKQGTLWDGKYLYDLYKEAYTPWGWHEELFHVAKEEGLICFSTPFDKTSVDFLESLGNPIYKIASFEITDIELIEYVALQHKPVILSTGIATLDDIQLAVDTCYNAGNKELSLLKCTSSYPAQISDANLATIGDMKVRFGVNIGLSDHTMGTSASIAAVALGATIIERHFILDRKIGGPDAAFSMEPNEFTEMVRQIREVEQAVGNVYYPINVSEIKGREFCRSLFVVEDIKKGEKLTRDNIRSIRPGNGLLPKYLNDVLGKTTNHDIEKGTPLSFDMVNSNKSV